MISPLPIPGPTSDADEKAPELSAEEQSLLWEEELWEAADRVLPRTPLLCHFSGFPHPRRTSSVWPRIAQGRHTAASALGNGPLRAH